MSSSKFVSVCLRTNKLSQFSLEESTYVEEPGMNKGIDYLDKWEIVFQTRFFG